MVQRCFRASPKYTPPACPCRESPRPAASSSCLSGGSVATAYRSATLLSSRNKRRLCRDQSVQLITDWSRFIAKMSWSVLGRDPLGDAPHAVLGSVHLVQISVSLCRTLLPHGPRRDMPNFPAEMCDDVIGDGGKLSIGIGIAEARHIA